MFVDLLSKVHLQKKSLKKNGVLLLLEDHLIHSILGVEDDDIFLNMGKSVFLRRACLLKQLMVATGASEN